MPRRPSLHVVCPKCAVEYEIACELDGKSVLCPECRTRFRAESVAEVLPVAPLDEARQDGDAPTFPRAAPSPPSGLDSAAHVYLYANQHRKGPFVESQVRAMWNSGAITADALYWREGMPGWKPVGGLLEGSGGAVSGRVRYDQKTDTFRGSLSAVVKLALRAVHNLGYRMDNANETLGLLTFQTGMTWSSWNGALCSLSFEERGPNTFRPIASAKANQSGGQIFAPDLFGELKGKATRVIDRMAELAD